MVQQSSMSQNKGYVLIINNDAWTTMKHRLGIIRALQEEGFYVKAAAAKYEDKHKAIEEICPFIEMKKINILSLNPLDDLSFMMEVRKLYKKEKPDVVLLYTIKPNIYGNMAAFSQKVKTISTVNGLGRTFSKKGILNFIVKTLFKVSFSRANKVIFQNHDDKQLFLDGNLVAQNSVCVVPGSGVDTNKFAPVNISKQDKKFKFLLASRLVNDKGIKEYAKAARNVRLEFPQAEFILLGPFTDKGGKDEISIELINQWQKEGIINYKGVSDDMPREIAESDVIVLPSYYREGVPRILLEALSMGKPIITTDNVGCRETVDDGRNGFIIPVRDVESLANASIKMITMPQEQLNKMGEESRAKAISEFDEQIVFSTYVKTIKELINP